MTRVVDCYHLYPRARGGSVAQQSGIGRRPDAAALPNTKNLLVSTRDKALVLLTLHRGCHHRRAAGWVRTGVR